MIRFGKVVFAETFECIVCVYMDVWVSECVVEAVNWEHLSFIVQAELVAGLGVMFCTLHSVRIIKMYVIM